MAWISEAEVPVWTIVEVSGVKVPPFNRKGRELPAPEPVNVTVDPFALKVVPVPIVILEHVSEWFEEVVSSVAVTDAERLKLALPPIVVIPPSLTVRVGVPDPSAAIEKFPVEVKPPKRVCAALPENI